MAGETKLAGALLPHGWGTLKRQLEALERQDLLAVMYGQPSDDQGGGFGGF